MHGLAPLVFALLIAGAAVYAVRRLVTRRVVHAGTVGLHYRDGVFVRTLAPGAYHFANLLSQHDLRVVPEGPVVLGNHEVSVISKDQFAFRLSLAPILRIVDPRAYSEQPGMAELGGYAGVHFPALHPRLAAAMLDQVAQHTLDEFLADPHAGLAAVKAALGGATPGAEVDELLLTAITMPPEVRKMFTEVERAKREGLASLERARAETASLRALANAARSLQDNPQLAQLRVLQAVENARGNKTIMLGNLPLAGTQGE